MIADADVQEPIGTETHPSARVLGGRVRNLKDDGSRGAGSRMAGLEAERVAEDARKYGLVEKKMYTAPVLA